VTGPALAPVAGHVVDAGDDLVSRLAEFGAANPDVIIEAADDGGFPSGRTWTATRTAGGRPEVVARARYAGELLSMLGRNLPLVRARDELAVVWGHWYLVWVGSGLLRARQHGSTVMLTGTSGAELAAAIEADAAAVRAEELALLRKVHGDIADDLRIEAGAFRGRWRFGSGREVIARSAREMDAVFRAGEAAPGAAKVIGLYLNEGLSIAKVAGRTGISFAKARRILERAGVTRPRPHRTVSGEMAEEIVTACTAGGLTLAQAAARTGRPVRTILNVLRRQLPPPEGDDLVRPSEGAQIAGVSAGYLASLAIAGTIRCVRLTPRGHRWYYRADIEALAARREARPR
jgi:hypothetical protein